MPDAHDTETLAEVRLTDGERDATPKQPRRRCSICAFYHRNGAGRSEDCTL